VFRVASEQCSALAVGDPAVLCDRGHFFGLILTRVAECVCVAPGHFRQSAQWPLTLRFQNVAGGVCWP
jgi:hypothetical protein